MPSTGAPAAALDPSLDPFQEAAERLTTIAGVGALAAAGMIAEIGCDMSRFAPPAHLISWAGLCPANDESAGKRRATRLRKGAPWLKNLPVQVAWSAARAKARYLPAPARPSARPPRAEESDHRGRRGDPDCRRLDAPPRHQLSGSRHRPLRPHRSPTPRHRLVCKLDQLGFTVTPAQRQTT